MWAGTQYPATVEETSNPVGSELQVLSVFPLEIPQQWGCPAAGHKGAPASPRDHHAMELFANGNTHT